MVNASDEHMEKAFELAQEALDNDEVPVGCVFTYREKQIGCGRNRVNCTKDPTTHAEMVALRSMEEENPNIKEIMHDLVLHVTLEPCIMCASGLFELGISKIVYAAANERFGGIYSVGNCSKYNQKDSNTKVIVDSRYADRSISLLKSFYDKQNPFAPEEKRKTKSR
ncbi:hypothetical protein RB195_000345 [Necator americanus]|uniref:CMP/dCMP-type deaminase domain-containing protein n=1 Tax=Necator americanus TaxID=51031 RepID=A0ABR1D982_NECAM